MVNNSELSNMTSNEKKNTVIKDYNDIAKEYADEFFGTKAYERYIDNFLKVLNGKKYLMLDVETELIVNILKIKDMI